MLLPNQQWIKVLKTGKNKEQAEKLVQKLANKGYQDLITLPPRGSYQKFRIGIFDESKLKIIDELNAKSRLKNQTCVFCGKSDNENNFFKCFNCGIQECYSCGFKRLFNKELPKIHNNDIDNFKILSNIGSCIKCRESLGFKSIPQKLRIIIMSKVPIGRKEMILYGMTGVFSTEKMFIDKEISLIYEDTLILIESIKNNNLNFTEWLKIYKNIISNMVRIEWSSDYILKVSDQFFKLVKRVYYREISMKMQYINPNFQLQTDLHKRIFTMIKNQTTMTDYMINLAQIATYITDRDKQLWSEEAKVAIIELLKLGDQIQNVEKYNEFHRLVEELIFNKQIRNVMEKIPPKLIS